MITLKTPNSQVTVDPKCARILNWQSGTAPSELIDLLYPAANGQVRQGGIPCIMPWFGVGPLGLGGNNTDFPKHGPFTDGGWEIISQPAPQQTINKLSLQRILHWSSNPYQGIVDIGTGAEKIQVTFEIILSPASCVPSSASHCIPSATTPASGRADILSLQLSFRNLSPATESFEAACHTYYRLPQPHGAEIIGLNGFIYEDATRPGHYAHRQTGPLTINSACDRIYYPATVPVRDGAITQTLVEQQIKTKNLESEKPSCTGNETTFVLTDPTGWKWHITHAGWPNAVVWFPDDGRDFICLEAAACRATGITLQPGETQTFGLQIMAPASVFQHSNR